MPFHRKREGGDVCAIFVHAGAGFHSFANEKHHLAACQDAAKVAMTVLKNGGGAVDAVEMAIKILEDREITNAGYGSNLTMDGTVECDATIVDHYGRSGAVGAASQIKNPIGLARLVLDESTKPLSLSRVPPNLLVGPGATDFAYLNGVPVLPHDYLISAGAKERWMRWRQDLQAAEEREATNAEASGRPVQSWDDLGQASGEEFSRPTTPPTPPISEGVAHLAQLATSVRPLVASTADLQAASYVEPRSYRGSQTKAHDFDSTLRNQSIDGFRQAAVDLDEAIDDAFPPNFKRPRISSASDGSFDGSMSPLGRVERFGNLLKRTARRPIHKINDDRITDTVGAIAVDCFGNIAAGSSSGGIGMKHRGRTGPAALVGIGTAIVPVDHDDSSRTCVATVTSGTGEHMATTMAAQTCADRIYGNLRKTSGGALINATEDEAMKSMIEKEFMGHPGVQHSHCAGAIGIMAVKKTKEGVFLYFGHNTDSFALASMHSEEKKPVCTMSRSTGNGAIAQGGRAAKYRRHYHHH